MCSNDLVFVLCFACRYGVILEKFQKKDVDLAGRIRGCVVDSAPVAVPDPKVSLLCIFNQEFKRMLICQKKSMCMYLLQNFLWCFLDLHCNLCFCNLLVSW